MLLMFHFMRLAIGRVKEKMMTDLTPYFVDHLKTLLEQAEEMKKQEPKSNVTRYWAVVYTDLEKVLAYVETFIVKGGSE